MNNISPLIAVTTNGNGTMMESPPRSVSPDGVIEAEDESDVPESDVPEIELIIKVSIQLFN